MIDNKTDRNISFVATEVLRELDDWTTVTEDGRVKIYSGHKYKLQQLINKLLRVCYLEYEKSNSTPLRDTLRLIVADALGQDFEQWLFLKPYTRKQGADIELPIAYLEDSRNLDGLQALRKALGMLGGKTAGRKLAPEKPAESGQSQPSKTPSEIELIEQFAEQLQNLVSIENCPKSAEAFNRWKIKLGDIINVDSFWKLADWLRYSDPALDDGTVWKEAEQLWVRANNITAEQADNYKVLGPVDDLRGFVSDLAGLLLRRAEIAEQRLKPAKPEQKAENVFKKTGDFWTVKFQGNTASIKDSKGMLYIAPLLEKPHQPISALKLAAQKNDTKLMNQGKVVEKKSIIEDSGKPQDLVDKDYLTDCKQRLDEIEEELRKAEKNNDPAEKDRLERERGQIRDLLKPALNLSGKSRSFSDNVQKTRVAVTMAIIRALKNINEHHPSLYRHLDNSIQRGTDFAYQPEKKISWQL